MRVVPFVVAAYVIAVAVCVIRVLGYQDMEWLLLLVGLTLPWSLASLPFLWSLIHGASPWFFSLLYLAGAGANAWLFWLYSRRNKRHANTAH